MKFIKRIGALLLALTMSAGMLIGCGGPAGEEADNAGSGTAEGGNAAGASTEGPIKIAFFGPLTGNMMQYGVSFQNAIGMKVEELNAAGGIDGREIEIISYDDKGDPKEAVNIANKIVADTDIKVAIGSFSSSCSMAAAPVFAEAGIMHLGPTASHPDFVNMGELTFTPAMPMALEGPADANYVYEKTGGKDMAVIYLNSDYGVSHANALKEAYEAAGGKVVAFEEFIPGQTKDFTPIIAKIKQTNPGALFVIADYSDGANIFKQAKKLELNCELVGPGMLIKQEFIDVAGDAVDGLLMVTSLPVYYEEDFENEDPNKAKFIKEYYEKFDVIPDGFPCSAYDCISILTDLIAEVGYDPAKIGEGFRNLGRYEGVSGNITLDPETKLAKRDLFVYTVKDGKFVIDEVVPAE